MDTTDISKDYKRPEIITKLFQNYDYKGFANEMAKIGTSICITTKQEQNMVEIKLKQLCSQVDMISLDFLNENCTLRDVYNAFHVLYSEESNILNEYKS